MGHSSICTRHRYLISWTFIDRKVTPLLAVVLTLLTLNLEAVAITVKITLFIKPPTGGIVADER
jgi:hypothetical protein